VVPVPRSIPSWKRCAWLMASPSLPADWPSSPLAPPREERGWDRCHCGAPRLQVRLPRHKWKLVFGRNFIFATNVPGSRLPTSLASIPSDPALRGLRAAEGIRPSTPGLENPLVGLGRIAEQVIPGGFVPGACGTPVASPPSWPPGCHLFCFIAAKPESSLRPAFHSACIMGGIAYTSGFPRRLHPWRIAKGP
jgi:hypothetical protein